MVTTFSAVSTALARSCASPQLNVTQAFLAIVVGPSITSSKIRVLLSIDGLEMRVWGSRDIRVGRNDTHSESNGAEEDQGSVTSSDEDEGEKSDGDHEEPEESEDEYTDDDDLILLRR